MVLRISSSLVRTVMTTVALCILGFNDDCSHHLLVTTDAFLSFVHRAVPMLPGRKVSSSLPTDDFSQKWTTLLQRTKQSKFFQKKSSVDELVREFEALIAGLTVVGHKHCVLLPLMLTVLDVRTYWHCVLNAVMDDVPEQMHNGTACC